MSYSYAQTNPVPPTCDPNFYDVMQARSIMEAKRDVEVSETFILKPDSVLELSCFDDRLTEVFIGANKMFSDNIFSEHMFNNPVDEYLPKGKWAKYLPEISRDRITAPRADEKQTGLKVGPNPPPYPPGALESSGLDIALRTLVYEVMREFLNVNFAHVYAGGTFTGGAGITPGVCNPMQLVWDFLKCQDYSKVMFLDFEQLALVDPRVKPSACVVPDRGNQWASLIQASDTDPGGLGGVEPVDLLLPLLDASQCGRLTPISTGVTITRNTPGGQISYEDGVCSAPGCYFDPMANNCN